MLTKFLDLCTNILHNELTEIPMTTPPTTYWNNNGPQQELAQKLRALIPASGPCPKDQKKLERFRKASNVYYRLHNDGRKTGVFATFGTTVNAEIEVKITQIILEAASEQKLI